MNNKLINNIVGLQGVVSKNSNYNAGFDKFPKTDGNGVIKASGVSYKYCIKDYWKKTGVPVFGYKEKNDNGKYLMQKEKCAKIFNKINNENQLIGKAFEYKDILNWGQVLASQSIGITGIVQIQDAINKYKDTNIQVEKLLSQFASKSNEKENTTPAERIITDEAHYIHPFSITVNQYDDYIGEYFKGYTKQDYEDFKDVSLKAVTCYNSIAKAGCKNEFGLFIKIKKEYNYILALGDLSEYVEIYKDENNKIVYDLIKLESLLVDCLDKIEDIEIYYNSRTMIIDGLISNNKLPIKQFDIITRKEL